MAAVCDRASWTVGSPLHNRLAIEDRPVHAWYRFVLSFPPHLVRDYFDRFGVGIGQTVLDPFCGTGTTLVEAQKHGITAVGIEANPMAALASRVKTEWTPDPGRLALEAGRIAGRSRALPDVLEALGAEEYKLLLSASISPLPLHRALAIRREIDNADPSLRDHLRLALAWALINGAGNVRFGPEVGITPPKTDADVPGIWQAQVERMAEDLRSFRGGRHASACVHLSDARSPADILAPESIDFVFTSPPYPNEKDYTRTTRLESVILGLISTRSELRQFKRTLLRSNTRNVYVGDSDDELVTNVPEVQRIARDIEERRKELGKTSGFERLYHRVAKLYFGGMARHFRELRPALRPGATLCYVVGDQASYLRIMIRTGQLLAQIAEREGYEILDVALFRTRYATATREQLREEVVLLRWPGA